MGAGARCLMCCLALTFATAALAQADCKLVRLGDSNMSAPTLGSQFGSDNVGNSQQCHEECLGTPGCQTAVYWAGGKKCFTYAAPYTQANTPSTSSWRKPSEVLYCEGAATGVAEPVNSTPPVGTPSAAGCTLAQEENTNMSDDTQIGNTFGYPESSRESCLKLCVATSVEGVQCQTAVFWDKPQGSDLCFLYAGSHTLRNSPSDSTWRKGLVTLHCSKKGDLAGDIKKPVPVIDTKTPPTPGPVLGQQPSAPRPPSDNGPGAELLPSNVIVAHEFTLQGYDVGQVAKGSKDLRACWAHCQRTLGCEAAVWISAAKKCYPKSGEMSFLDRSDQAGVIMYLMYTDSRVVTRYNAGLFVHQPRAMQPERPDGRGPALRIAYKQIGTRIGLPGICQRVCFEQYGQDCVYTQWDKDQGCFIARGCFASELGTPACSSTAAINVPGKDINRVNCKNADYRAAWDTWTGGFNKGKTYCTFITDDGRVLSSF